MATNANLPSNIPNPDPSVVANERLEEAKTSIRREMAAYREEAKGWIEALQKLHQKTIESNREESKGWIETLQRLFEREIKRLEEVSKEKFASIVVQFAERDTRTEQTAAGVKIAVDAALQAAKEAVAEQNRSFALATGKSETATMKQIDALGLAIQTANKGLDDKIADMKDRLTRIEGMDLGSGKSRSHELEDSSAARHDRQNLIGLIGVCVAVVAILVSVIVGVYTVTRPAPLAPAIVYAQPPGSAGPAIPRRESLPDLPERLRARPVI
jgi:hypothetical protein